ncbi:MAG: hypothetical protein AAGD10_02855 [Myxococcota bacterium]
MAACVLMFESEARASNSFFGTVSGQASTVVNLQHLDIVGIKVEVRKKDFLNDPVIGEGYTGEQGLFEIDFNEADSSETIEIYLRFVAETAGERIRVRKKTIPKSTRKQDILRTDPIVVTPGAHFDSSGHDVHLDRDELKPQLLHWANRARQFVMEEGPSGLIPDHDGHHLDILTRPSGVPGSSAMFVPRTPVARNLFVGGLNVGSYVVELFNAAFPTLLITSVFLDTQFSDHDGIYIPTSTRTQNRPGTVMHEFGHYVMWHAQNESWLPALDAGFFNHGVDYNTLNPRLAWTEGFADFFGAVVEVWSRSDLNDPLISSSTVASASPNWDERVGTWDEPVSGAVDCGGTSSSYCSEDQALTHGMHGQGLIARALYDLWDGPSNLALGPGIDDAFVPSSEEYGDEELEFTFEEIMRPITNNPGTKGFGDGQSNHLLNNIAEYHEEFLSLRPSSNDMVVDAHLFGLITRNFDDNKIRHLLVDHPVPAAAFKEADLLNSDELVTSREIEVVKIKDDQDDSEEGEPAEPDYKGIGKKKTEMTVSISTLRGSRDSYNVSSIFSDQQLILSDDIAVEGDPVNGNATLFFNDDRNVGFMRAGNNYGVAPGVLSSALRGDPAQLDLVGGMELAVRDGGSLVLGDDGGLTSVETIVHEGTTLRLGGGLGGPNPTPDPNYSVPVSIGRLVIHAGSTLILERGSTLIIEPGAQIQLSGPGATLIIRGNVVVQDDAVFTWTAGLGTVFFNLPTENSDNVVMGEGSSILVDESSFTVAAGTYIRPDAGIFGRRLTIQDSSVTLQQGAFVDAADLILAVMDTEIGGSGHAGFITHGIRSLFLRSEFSTGGECVSADDRYGDDEIIMNEVDFFDCGTSVSLEDATLMGHKVRSSGGTTGIYGRRSEIWLDTPRLFDADVGLFTEGPSDQIRITNGEISGHAVAGIRARPIPSSDIGAITAAPLVALGDIAISDNEVGIWVEGNTTVRVQDCVMNDNARTAMLLESGALADIGLQARNTFRRSPVYLELDRAAVPALAFGENDFFPESLAGGGLVLQGTTLDNLSCTSPLWNPSIPVSTNDWFSNPSPPPVVFLTTTPLEFVTNYSLVNQRGCAYSFVP